MENFQLPNKVYENSLREIVKNNFNIHDFEIECSAGSSRGDNFLGIIYRICVISKSEKINFILKFPPQNETRRQQCDSRLFFLRESEFYENVCRIYRDFQIKKGIKIKTEGFYEVPHCYKSLTEEPFEALFFEDLKEQGFQLLNTKKCWTKDHVMLVLKALAKMHAIFYCIKNQTPEVVEKYRTLTDTFTMSFSDKNTISNSWICTQIELAIKLIERQEESEFKKKVLNFLKKDFFESFNELVDGKNAEPYAVLCYGDVREN